MTILMAISGLLSQFKHFAVSCGGNPSFFSFPTWYQYLPGTCTNGTIELPKDPGGAVDIFSVIPLIILAIVEILLRVAALVAIGYVVYGGAQYVTSQGEPDKVANAKGTILNALVGLVIATFAIAIVGFIGARVG